MYSSILFPVDFEHESSWKKALPTVKSLAKSSGASIRILNVVADTQLGMAAEYFPPDFESKLVAQSREKLADFIAQHMADVPGVSALVEKGRPYKAIVAAAEREECDLIIMASHQPQVIDILIGPNADYVVRHASISVFIVRD